MKISVRFRTLPHPPPTTIPHPTDILTSSPNNYLDDSLLTTTTTTTNTAAPHSLTHLKEIGNLASWTVSTAKPGCGVPELRSDDTSLFWQSDGPQPHTINIHFAKRVLIKLIRIYLDYKSDESYTPTKLAVMSGTGYHDLQEVCVMVLEEPLGWVEVDLGAGGVRDDGEEGRGENGEGGCLRSWLVQVVILGNHQNGKDTHVRGLQVFAAASPPVEVEEVPYTSSGMLAELGWR
ncbi:APC10-domain-containing protein [Terfezia boudieri ATCC MYA-4762]|uniref:APC10-domain-containing protein n=1 Tax=Terfezia boudieri ATCC MYA-4762 TaxID=1051890 RepID=A0A3N4LPA4_9PEZI|nr:APC10-domain-containing protein [Terfezia boudieri ATCC MYA-4762]